MIKVTNFLSCVTARSVTEWNFGYIKQKPESVGHPVIPVLLLLHAYLTSGWAQGLSLVNGLVTENGYRKEKKKELEEKKGGSAGRWERVLVFVASLQDSVFITLTLTRIIWLSFVDRVFSFSPPFTLSSTLLRYPLS